MTSLPLCLIISVSMLLYKSAIPVQGRVVDAKTPPGKFNETMADAALADQCGVKLTKRIVGGQHASPGEWRWHVELAEDYGSHGTFYFCGGSLLSPQWVITAAHCVERKQTGDILATLGQHSRLKDSGNEQAFSIGKRIMHPWFRRRNFTGFDFALLKLAKPATINHHVGTICLPESTKKLPVGTVLWETGWGRTSHGGQESDMLN